MAHRIPQIATTQFHEVRRALARLHAARRGFTLLELLVCVACIAILAALLLPALARAKARGSAIACLNNLRQLSIACIIYTHEYGDRFPYNLGAADILRGVSRGRFYNWTSPVLNWELDGDNTNRVLLTRGGIGPYTGPSTRVYRCPEDKVLSDIQEQAGWVERVRSSSMNAMVGNAGEYTAGGNGNVNNPGYRQFFRTSQVPQPGHLFIFIEEHPDSVNDGYFLNRHHSQRWMDLPGSYHNGSANLTFADGHTEQRAWRFPSTKLPNRPDAAPLPFVIPPDELGDFNWLMERTSVDSE